MTTPRITNVAGDPAALDDLIDEVVLVGTGHLEMLDDTACYLSLDGRVFSIYVEGDALRVRYLEDRRTEAPKA